MLKLVKNYTINSYLNHLILEYKKIILVKRFEKKSNLKLITKTFNKKLKNYFSLKFFIRKKIFKKIIYKNLSKKFLINSIFLKLTLLNNNIFLNIFFKHKIFKNMLNISLGYININGKKKRRSALSIKLISLACKLFLKKLILKIKKKKIKIKKFVFIFPKCLSLTIYYTFIFTLKLFIFNKDKYIKKKYNENLFNNKIIKYKYFLSKYNYFLLKNYQKILIKNKLNFDMFKKIIFLIFFDNFLIKNNYINKDISNKINYLFLNYGLKPHNGCRTKKTRRL